MAFYDSAIAFLKNYLTAGSWWWFTRSRFFAVIPLFSYSLPVLMESSRPIAAYETSALPHPEDLTPFSLG